MTDCSDLKEHHITPFFFLAFSCGPLPVYSTDGNNRGTTGDFLRVANQSTKRKKEIVSIESGPLHIEHDGKRKGSSL
jgi:hypothetical protein